MIVGVGTNDKFIPFWQSPDRPSPTMMTRCGNAVPPVMMFHIASTLAPILAERVEAAA